MKKAISALLIAAITISMAACGGSSSGSASSGSATKETTAAAETKAEAAAPSGDVVKMTFATGNAENHVQCTDGYEKLLQGIEAAGPVEFTRYYSGELLGYGAEIDGIRDGAADCAGLVPFFDTRTQLDTLIQLPLAQSSMEDIHQAVYELLDSTEPVGDTGKSYYQMTYGDLGLKAFLSTEMTPYFAAFIEGKDPNDASIYTKATRVRTSNSLGASFIENLGMTSVTMTIADVYDAMSRGELDGLVNPAAWVTYSLEDTVKYLLSLKLGYATQVLIFTEDSFAKLPQECQDYLTNGDYKEMIGESIAALNQAEKDQIAACEANGAKYLTVEDLDPAIQEKVNASLVKCWYDWIDMMEGQGLPGKDLAVMWMGILQKHNCLPPQEIIDNLADYVPASK